MKWADFREKFRDRAIASELEVLQDMQRAGEDEVAIKRKDEDIRALKAAKYLWQMLDVCKDSCWDVDMAVSTLLEVAGVEFPPSKPGTKMGRIPASDDGRRTMASLMSRDWCT